MTTESKAVAQHIYLTLLVQFYLLCVLRGCFLLAGQTYPTITCGRDDT